MIIRFSSRESNQIAFEDAIRRMDDGDYLGAFKGFLAIAQRGHTPSMSMLGTLLTRHGLELKDYGGYEEGISWYRKAATCGDVSAIKALSELNEEQVPVFKPMLRIIVPNILVYVLSLPFMMFTTIVGIHMLHTFLIVVSVMCYVAQFSQSYYMFEPGYPRRLRHIFEVERENAFTSVVMSMIHIIGMLLFVIGFGLAARDVSKGNYGLFTSMLVQILISAGIIYLNTTLLVRVKRRVLTDAQYKALMNLKAKLGKRWEALTAPMLLLCNFALFAICLYMVVANQ